MEQWPGPSAGLEPSTFYGTWPQRGSNKGALGSPLSPGQLYSLLLQPQKFWDQETKKKKRNWINVAFFALCGISLS